MKTRSREQSRRCQSCAYEGIASLRDPCYSCLNASTPYDAYPDWVAKPARTVSQPKEPQDGCKE